MQAKAIYAGEVAPGSSIIQADSGTMGFTVQIRYEEGGAPCLTSYTIWITERNRERATEDFGKLGIREEELRDERFLLEELPKAIEGVKIKFGTKEDNYKGEARVKVSWIDTFRTASPEACRRVANFFGQPKAVEEWETAPGGPSAPRPSNQTISDSDIPF